MKNVKKQTIYTIGHSTRPIEEFIDLLHTNKMKTLVDVRSLPGSNKFPQYNQEVLSETLKNEDIEYIYMKELGGRRQVLKNSINTSWRNKSFQGYADYMGTEEYREVLERLMSIASKKKNYNNVCGSRLVAMPSLNDFR
ncbi:DUF488 domain-containing protein [Balneicella halophila]|uniref:DUF488 domain-containing protein n=1 Tax=Balneicella halophila TaxID=1537566 RepID=UPI001A9C4BAA|nr:DUF488 domain-containing protein [Balneicella halophila]